MSKDDIIRMALESGMIVYEGDQDRVLFEGGIVECLTRFAKLIRNDYSNKHAQLWLKRIDEAVKAEREACAKVADEWVRAYPHPSGVIAERIRARGNDEKAQHA